MSEPPSPVEPASIDEMAALEFTPWQGHEGEWTPPTNKEWTGLANPHLVSVRLAWATLHKSKEELIAVAEQLGDKALMELVGQIGQSADWFEGMHRLLACAECRLICAFAVRSAHDESELCSGVSSST